ncbi:MAG: tRNA (cytidine(34)-2'-O)-methyltransferase [Raoultibacter sp.]|jgi:tRNA (cytidine/uridine-2'-O-)-methyltransferase
MADLNIVLVEPEIPQNAGNVARTCACVGARLHLVEPMGFRLSERQMKRAGLDYWDEVEIERYPSMNHFLEYAAGRELHFFTGQAERIYTDVEYGKDAFLLFGRESAGINPEILEAHKNQCLRIPMRDGLRSLNLSNAVAIASYEVLRSWDFRGLL